MLYIANLLSVFFKNIPGIILDMGMGGLGIGRQ